MYSTQPAPPGIRTGTQPGPTRATDASQATSSMPSGELAGKGGVRRARRPKQGPAPWVATLSCHLGRLRGLSGGKMRDERTHSTIPTSDDVLELNQGLLNWKDGPLIKNNSTWLLPGTLYGHVQSGQIFFGRDIPEGLTDFTDGRSSTRTYMSMCWLDHKGPCT